MADYRLVRLWGPETTGSVSDIRMSASGEYLLVKGNGRIAYYNWEPRLLWQGNAQGVSKHMVVDSNRDQVLAASHNMIYSYNRNGDLLWDGLTEWRVQALHLSATVHCIVASNGTRVGCLDQKGKPIWQHDLRKTAQCIAVSPNGQWILAGGEDNRVTCLNQQGQVAWTSQFDRQVVSISAGEGMVAVGDAGKVVHCLDSDGYELCHHETRGQLKSIAASANDKYVAVGTEDELHQFFLTNAEVFFVPIRPGHAGAGNALEQLGASNIQNIFMNHDGGCLLVEGMLDQRCYDLEGTLLWSCPKIDVSKPRPREVHVRPERKPVQPEEPRRETVSPEIEALRKEGERLLREAEERRQRAKTARWG